LKIIKAILMVIAFIIIKLFGWLFISTRKTIDVGADAFHSVKNSDSFDEAYRNFASNKYAKARLSIPEEIIALMAKIASSDGKISELEVEYMSDTILSIAKAMIAAGLNERLVEQVKKKLFRLANQAKRDDKPVCYYGHLLPKSSVQVRTGAMLQMISFAYLDGLSDKTKATLFEIGACLHFSQSQIEHFFEEVHGASRPGYDLQKNPYEILGCDESDDFSKIKKAYRQQVKQNHPDYMHGKGLNDVEIKKATEKMQEINAAYEEVKRRNNL